MVDLLGEILLGISLRWHLIVPDKPVSSRQKSQDPAGVAGISLGMMNQKPAEDEREEAPPEFPQIESPFGIKRRHQGLNRQTSEQMYRSTLPREVSVA